MDTCIIFQQVFNEFSPALVVFKKDLATLIKISRERQMSELNVHVQGIYEC